METSSISQDHQLRRQRKKLGRFTRLRKEYIPDSAFYVIPSSTATVLTFLLVSIVILVMGLHFSTHTVAHHQLATKNDHLQKLSESASANILIAVYTHSEAYLNKTIANVAEIKSTVADIVPELSEHVREEFLAFFDVILLYSAQTMATAIPLINNVSTSASDFETFHYNLKMLRENREEGYSIVSNYTKKVIADDDKTSQTLMIISTILSFGAVPVTISVAAITICCDYKNKKRLQLVHTEQLHETLHDEDERERFLSFCKKEYSAENLLCWVEIAEYKQMDDPEARCKKVRRIFDQYLAPNSPSQVNIELSGVNMIKRKLQAFEAKKGGEEPEITLFEGIAQELEKNMQDTHARYKKFKQSIIQQHKDKFHLHLHLHHHSKTKSVDAHGNDAQIEMGVFGTPQHHSRTTSTFVSSSPQPLHNQQQQQQQHEDAVNDNLPSAATTTTIVDIKATTTGHAADHSSTQEQQQQHRADEVVVDIQQQ